MPPDPKPPRNPIDRLSLIRSSSHTKFPSDHTWQDGRVPDREPAFVCVDGFYSQSFPTARPAFTPLITSLQPWIESTGSFEQTRGLSYRFPSRHYEAAETDIQLLEGEPFEKLEEYLLDQKTDALGTFSLGGPLTLLGLADWLNIHKTTSYRPSRLILIQPALALSQGVQNLVRLAPKSVYVPQPLYEMTNSAVFYEPAILESLATIRAAGVSVVMLYWEGDSLFDYSGWPQRFRDLGASAVPLNNLPLVSISPDRLIEAFDEHCKIVRQEITRQAFMNALRSNG